MKGSAGAPMQPQQEQPNALASMFGSYADGQNSQLQMMQTPEAAILDPQMLYRDPSTAYQNPYALSSPEAMAALDQLRGRFADEEAMVQPSPYRTSASVKKQRLNTALAKKAY